MTSLQPGQKYDFYTNITHIMYGLCIDLQLTFKKNHLNFHLVLAQDKGCAVEIV